MDTSRPWDGAKDTDDYYPEWRREQLGARVVVWFSCGAASAVAAKCAITDYGSTHEVVLAYCDTGAEHPDNGRFLRDCEEWLGHPVIMLKNEKYEDTWDVWEKTQWLVGPAGARCTGELKRNVRKTFEDRMGDIQVFGYCAEEKHRADRYRENNKLVWLETPLIDRGLTKADCLAVLREAGIELPAMYELGFRNNNCIPCVKGGAGYWNLIRRVFPEQFARMAKVERQLNTAINKRYENGERIRVFLDELPEDAGNYEAEPDIECGIACRGVVEGCRPTRTKVTVTQVEDEDEWGVCD